MESAVHPAGAERCLDFQCMVVVDRFGAFFFFSSSSDINADGLPGEWYKQVTKPAVQEFQGKNGKQWNTLTGVNNIRC